MQGYRFWDFLRSDLITFCLADIVMYDDMLCCVSLFYVVLCYVVLGYGLLCYALLCYVVVCYVI